MLKFKNFIILFIILEILLTISTVHLTKYLFKKNAHFITSLLRNDILRNDILRAGQFLDRYSENSFSVISINLKNEVLLKKENFKAFIPISFNSFISLNSNYNLNDIFIKYEFDLFPYLIIDTLISFIFAIFVDIIIRSHFKKKERAIKILMKQETDEQLNLAAIQLSHDIRSPLATLNSISENLTGSNQEDIKLLKLSIDRINQISNSLLDKNKENKLQKFNLIKTVSNIILLKHSEHKNAVIHFNDKVNKIISINGNKIEFERMLSNLINNAIESSTAPKVEIKIEQHDNKILLSIKDNGQGIPQSVIEKLGKENITTKENGNGLGLSHAIKTINQLNAKIKFHSSNEGTNIEIAFDDFSTEIVNTNKIIVLIEDDILTQMNWEHKAKKSKIELVIYSNKKDLIENISKFNLETTFYIDSELGKDSGEDLALHLSNLGYKNLFMATGHSPGKFSHLTFLNGVIGKNPPF